MLVREEKNSFLMLGNIYSDNFVPHQFHKDKNIKEVIVAKQKQNNRTTEHSWNILSSQPASLILFIFFFAKP
jgi:hypothetical protein